MDARFTEAIARAARAIQNPRDLDATLDAIAKAALISLPGFDAIGISTIDNKGNVQTRASTSELVHELDRLQYGLGEGPCVDTLRDAGVVVAPEIQHDQRWPQYVPKAVALGLKSQLAVKLYLDAQGTVGGLNIYSTQSERIDPDAQGIAELFATHAAIALGQSREFQGLHEALSTRTIIGQAVGMMMHQHTLTQDGAFDLLVTMSSHTNIKVRDIAAQMVEEANEKAAPVNPDRAGR